MSNITSPEIDNIVLSGIIHNEKLPAPLVIVQNSLRQKAGCVRKPSSTLPPVGRHLGLGPLEDSPSRFSGPAYAQILPHTNSDGTWQLTDYPAALSILERACGDPNRVNNACVRVGLRTCLRPCADP